VRLLQIPGPTVRLETERFTLVTVPRFKAARLSFPWSRIPEVVVPFGEAANQSFATWRKRMPYFDNRRRFCFAISPKATRTVIGLDRIIVDRDRNASLAVIIGDRDWWGKGVVVETREAIIDFCFDVLKCARISSLTSAANYASVANYQMLGFKAEGVLRQHRVDPAGHGRLDMIAFGLLRDEWRARRKGSP
jgi:RimJ/RimL family protein N-acetyltransferase